jgi:hypothetical protein
MKRACLILLLLAGVAICAGCLNLPAEDRGLATGDSSKYQYSEGGEAVPAPMIASTPSAAFQYGTDQKLIKTGSVRLEVKDVPGSVEALKEIALRHQGYLSSSSLSGDSSDRLSATVTVRVPSDAFDTAVTEIKALGILRSAAINAEDITEEYVDLQAQKGSLERQLEQYNRILEKTETVEDVLKTQVQIGRVQTELDRLEGRLRYLDNRIDLATITVFLQEPAPLGGDTGHSFISAVNSGIQGFLATIDGIIIAFFTLLPLIILAVLGYGIYRWRKGKSAHSAPAMEKK